MYAHSCPVVSGPRPVISRPLLVVSLCPCVGVVGWAGKIIPWFCVAAKKHATSQHKTAHKIFLQIQGGYLRRALGRTRIRSKKKCREKKCLTKRSVLVVSLVVFRVLFTCMLLSDMESYEEIKQQWRAE
jgi:hypothetical protein